MKNLYANNTSNELIHIDDVDKSLHHKFHCFNCNDEMIARKGKTNAHHFSHKKLTCSFESYIHKLAKLKFYEQYRTCLKDEIPFFIEYKINQTCTSCLTHEKIQVSCALNNKIEKLDLTKVFDIISVEKKHNGFVADIILESSKIFDKIFIEFAVTHQCTHEKINSGLRIIEINIQKESDILQFNNCHIEVLSENIKFYNFTAKHFRKSFYDSNSCKMPFYFFRIFKNGSAKLDSTKMYGIVQDLQDENLLYHEIIEFDYRFNEEKKFIQLVQAAADSGIAIKNCHACRFITENKRREQYYSLFCKLHKAEIVDSNHACKKFWKK
jgi:hypothetical protein